MLLDAFLKEKLTMAFLMHSHTNTSEKLFFWKRQGRNLVLTLQKTGLNWEESLAIWIVWLGLSTREKISLKMWYSPKISRKLIFLTEHQLKDRACQRLTFTTEDIVWTLFISNAESCFGYVKKSTKIYIGKTFCTEKVVWMEISLNYGSKSLSMTPSSLILLEIMTL